MELDRFEDIPGMTMAARALDQPPPDDEDGSIEIDVSRVVWDQDYRRRVMDELKRREQRNAATPHRPKAPKVAPASALAEPA